MNNLPDDDLVVLSASGQPVGLSSKASNALAGAVENLGGVLLPGTGSAADLATGQWSLIGINGLPQGDIWNYYAYGVNPPDGCQSRG
ncbi:MAG TPA: hypothetical protein VGF25_20880 [Thermoleophilaceae bacterium]